MTPLHTAVKRGYADIVARLLQTGQVDIDAQVSFIYCGYNFVECSLFTHRTRVAGRLLYGLPI